MTKVINLFAGPGAGKSTTAADIFAKLKQNGYSAELVREFAKDVVWEGRHHLLDDQLFIFAEQRKRVLDLVGKVDYIVTDSPLLLSLVYCPEDELLSQLVLREHFALDNANFFLRRVKRYVEAGRIQSEDEARQLDTDIFDMLAFNGIFAQSILGDAGAAHNILLRLGLDRRPSIGQQS